jgi:hypothetical protein
MHYFISDVCCINIVISLFWINYCMHYFSENAFDSKLFQGNAFAVDFMSLCPKLWLPVYIIHIFPNIWCLSCRILNLELAHIFLSSSHHLAFSGWPVLYFKWLCIYMIYQCWWYHTVIHLVDDLYYTSNDSAICIYMIYQCWWYHTVFHLYLGFA